MKFILNFRTNILSWKYIKICICIAEFTNGIGISSWITQCHSEHPVILVWFAVHKPKRSNATDEKTYKGNPQGIQREFKVLWGNSDVFFCILATNYWLFVAVCNFFKGITGKITIRPFEICLCLFAVDSFKIILPSFSVLYSLCLQCH